MSTPKSQAYVAKSVLLAALALIDSAIDYEDASSLGHAMVLIGSALDRLSSTKNRWINMAGDEGANEFPTGFSVDANADDSLIDRPNRGLGQVIVDAIVKFERVHGASWRAS